ncbi:hypothetical protein M406DRAFT_268203 [Cryphonectria parasitica EP155]|uniref:Microbial-type PARG catalytic domain-containing protein n=1 Tax=Cryphonectria parasitica (strain ATCC 38755 / EP155) TaxID=660469 RepID=A0A9P4XU34_CRYP1|nr:uncharacterized protein M406DRAFT_268203 [Cryphonectria parasitica EP155]KAF3760993.1 hypothetical protein M406DRAFT_268203 [Cryphonectria parasitica EP155]
MVDFRQRREICEDTIERSPAIVQATPGATLDSTFMPAQLPALSPEASPQLKRKPVRVIDADSFAAARAILANDPGAKVAVLNLASDIEPAGGWRFSLSCTQEEALCYSSTLYPTLRHEWYPWPNLGPRSAAGIYSPGVVVFRDTLDAGLVELPEDQRFVVSVITVAAPMGPPLAIGRDGRLAFAMDSVLRDLQEKIKLVYRCAAHNGQTSLVLGAMGCGAFRCPPEVVAREMREILEDDEFAGWFENVVFAVYAVGRGGQRNLEVFHGEFTLLSI